MNIVNFLYEQAHSYWFDSLQSKDQVPLAIPGKEDVIVAIMGATGTGKSSFVRLVTGDETIIVGHGLHSCKQLLIVPNIEVSN
jgi:predicted GTPase